MPTFAEMPFTMDDVPDPAPEANLPPRLMQAIRLLFVEVVSKADDLVALSALDTETALTENDIEMVRTGMIAGSTTLLGLLMEQQLFNNVEFVHYLRELLRKSA